MSQSGHVRILSEPSTFDMANEWYAFADKSHFWFEWRFRALQAALRGLDLGPCVLDIGCGNGAALEQFERWLDRPADGCDVNLVALEHAKAVRGDLYFYNICDRRPAWKEHFSALLLLDVLEHLEDPSQLLSAALYHLKPGGVCVVNVPAMPSLFSAYDRVQGHRCRFTAPALVSLLSDSGLEVVATRHWGLLNVPVLALRKLRVARVETTRVMQIGFQPPNRIAAAVLRGMMRFETFLPFAMPFGPALVMVARKGSA